MTRGLLFWIIWILCILAWVGVNFFGLGGGMGSRMAGGGVIEFILFGLLGWQVFGPVIHG
jgi:hypothetical protein